MQDSYVRSKEKVKGWDSKQKKPEPERNFSSRRKGFRERNLSSTTFDSGHAGDLICDKQIMQRLLAQRAICSEREAKTKGKANSLTPQCHAVDMLMPVMDSLSDDWCAGDECRRACRNPETGSLRTLPVPHLSPYPSCQEFDEPRNNCLGQQPTAYNRFLSLPLDSDEVHPRLSCSSRSRNSLSLGRSIRKLSKGFHRGRSHSPVPHQRKKDVDCSAASSSPCRGKSNYRDVSCGSGSRRISRACTPPRNKLDSVKVKPVSATEEHERARIDSRSGRRRSLPPIPRYIFMVLRDVDDILPESCVSTRSCIAA